MGWDGTKITKPVGVGDVSVALPHNSLDVGTLCMSSQINKWSKFKPIRFGNRYDELKGDDRVGSTAEIQAGYYYGVKIGVSDLRELISRTDNLEYHNVIAGFPFRLLDFDGYVPKCYPNMWVFNVPTSFQIPASGTSHYYDFNIEYNSGNTYGIDYVGVMGDLSTLQKCLPVFIIEVDNKYYATYCELQNNEGIQPLYYKNHWDTAYRVNLAAVPGINQTTDPVLYEFSVGLVKSEVFPKDGEWHEINDTTYDNTNAYSLYGGIKLNVAVAKQESIIPAAECVSYSIANGYITLRGRLKRTVADTMYVAVTITLEDVNTRQPYQYNLGYLIIRGGSTDFEASAWIGSEFFSGDTVDINWFFTVYNQPPTSGLVIGVPSNGTITNVIIL